MRKLRGSRKRTCRASSCAQERKTEDHRPDARQIVIDTPSILFFSRPRLHRLHGPEEEGAELVCATIEFGAGMLNPLIASLPEPLVLPLDALPELAPTLQLLFSEAFSQSPGARGSVEKLNRVLSKVSGAVPGILGSHPCRPPPASNRQRM